jgi:hypothetical protein
MKPNEMHKLAHAGCHECAPKGWRNVPNMSGDYDLDATILHRSNKSLPDRLALYLKHRPHAYGYRTGYDSYHAYSGDD